jgi:hypothetical protein
MEAICRQSTLETRALRRKLPEAFSRSASPQDAITNGIVKPGIEILSHESTRLRDLGVSPSSSSLKIYLGLFEPIVELARQRLQVGTAGENERAHSLELLIAGLEDEQSAAARRVGLDACSVGFNRALEGSA